MEDRHVGLDPKNGGVEFDLALGHAVRPVKSDLISAISQPSRLRAT